MLVATKFSELPEFVSGIEFLIDWVTVRGVPGRMALAEVDRVYRTDADHALGIDSVISGHVIVRDKESGGTCSLLDNGIGVLVDVYAEPQGIFIGGVCVVLAHDLADEHGRWWYWTFTAGQLLKQALDVLNDPLA